MIEKWNESADNGRAFGAPMTDLSRTFKCLHHWPLITRRDAYGFDIKPVKLIQQYISKIKLRVKEGNAYSLWKEFFCGISQGSILVLFVSNIFLCDLFYFLEGVAVAISANDTIPYKTNGLAIKEMQHFSEALFK